MSIRRCRTAYSAFSSERSISSIADSRVLAGDMPLTKEKGDGHAQPASGGYGEQEELFQLCLGLFVDLVLPSPQYLRTFRSSRSKNRKVYRAGVMSEFGQTPLCSLVDLSWRTAFRLGFPLARLWWRMTAPRHEGVLVAAYIGPALLLVRSSYRRGWHLPGGGVRRGEMPETAARRSWPRKSGFGRRSSCCGLYVR
jgi:hypothetical protein